LKRADISRPDLERDVEPGTTMSGGYVDLHCHSTASDGTLPPREVVRLAKVSGLVGLSLTDHDTVAGINDAQDEAQQLELQFISGIEISCTFPSPGTLHMLGYGVDPDSPVLREMMRQLIDARDNRNPRIIAKLNELGVAITMDELNAEARGAVVGRPHIAAILHRRGYVSSIKQAFDKYLAQGAPAYFDKERLPPQRALELIDRSGGLAVLAHPIQLRTTNDAELDRVVKDLVDLGLAGIETIHSDHDFSMVEKCTRLAERYNLLQTGGSDFHGTNKKDIGLGSANGRRIPRQMMDRLMERLLDDA
jgi:predicted metal-dependent phosphoesterase TrpH